MSIAKPNAFAAQSVREALSRLFTIRGLLAPGKQFCYGIACCWQNGMDGDAGRESGDIGNEERV